MSARDKYHDIVKSALIHEGWTITHDPYRIAIGATHGDIDLGAEMPIAAERDHERIAVEVKSFLSDSEIYDLERALGQYGMYRVVLQKLEPDRVLYLAVPNTMRKYLLTESDYRDILRDLRVRVIFFDPEGKEQTEWINPASLAP
jgi:hypothetical protein